jgi:endonuclease YncB( thermonuclease family)
MSKLYTGDILKAVDGDTFDIRIDLGFSISYAVRIRLKGINCEELKDIEPKNKELAIKAAELGASYVGKRATVIVHERDKYGRWVSDLIIDGNDYAQLLLDKHLAQKVF